MRWIGLDDSLQKHLPKHSMDVVSNPKIGGDLWAPKMDGENFMGKPYEQMDDLGVPLFLDTSQWSWFVFTY